MSQTAAHNNEQYTLYGTPFSLYTGKAKAFLLAKKQPFREVFSSLWVYRKVIVPQTGVRFIPVLETPQGEFIQDTAVMIDLLEQRHPESSIIPSSPKQKLVTYLLELFADEWLVIPAMHYRWNYDNAPQIYQEFGSAVLPGMPTVVRVILGRFLSTRFKNFLPPLGITPRMHDAIEAWFENDILAVLERHLREMPYLLGDMPTLADCAFMGPIYAHLLRDSGSGKKIRALAPHVNTWAKRMSVAGPENTSLLAHDEIPETLLPILRCIFQMQWPVLEASVNTLQRLNAEGVERIPRVIGDTPFTIQGVTETRKVMSFHQWKLQRLLACYKSFSGRDKDAVDVFLKSLGGYDAMQKHIPSPVVREKNRLVFA